MIEDLIYDVGMHNGDDTAYYLESGYQVVAIEANPMLVRKARQRFADALAQGRLQIFDVGILVAAPQDHLRGLPCYRLQGPMQDKERRRRRPRATATPQGFPPRTALTTRRDGERCRPI